MPVYDVHIFYYFSIYWSDTSLEKPGHMHLLLFRSAFFFWERDLFSYNVNK